MPCRTLSWGSCKMVHGLSAGCFQGNDFQVNVDETPGRLARQGFLLIRQQGIFGILGNDHN